MIVEYAGLVSAFALLAASTQRLVRTERRGRLRVGRHEHQHGHEGGRSEKVPVAGAKAYKRAPYRKPALKYLYALGWIGGTKHRAECGLTLLARIRRSNRPRSRVRSNAKLRAQLRKRAVSVGAAASALVGASSPLARDALGRFGSRLASPPSTRRKLTIPSTSDPSTTGRWRKPLSSITRAASSSDMSGGAVIGSGVIHCRTRASLVCTRAAIARSMSRSLRIPMRRPKSFDDCADVPFAHSLRDLAERVLGRDGDEGRLDDLGKGAH